jgi:hypothetical protein
VPEARAGKEGRVYRMRTVRHQGGVLLAGRKRALSLSLSLSLPSLALYSLTLSLAFARSRWLMTGKEPSSAGS